MTAGTDGAGLLPEHAAPICRRGWWHWSSAGADRTDPSLEYMTPICRRNRQILWSCWFV